MFKSLRILDKAFDIIDLVIYSAMIFVVLLQIVARACFPVVPAWTEEASRYLQVYLVAFAAGAAIRYDAFVRVDTIFSFVRGRAELILRMMIDIVILILFCIILYSSIGMIKVGIPRSATSMTSLSMGVVYFSVMIMSISTVFNIIRKIFATAMKLREGGAESCVIL